MFFHDEKLYWRRKKPNDRNPFSSITLADVSINRSGTKNEFFSNPEDVLWNLEANDEVRYANQGVITIAVKKIGLNENFVREFSKTEDGITETVKMNLIHDPIICNKAHSMFRFVYKEEIVTFDNYKEGLGQSRKALKRLRRECKDELVKIIVSRVVNFDLEE